MNNCVLMAEVIQEPQLRYTSDTQTPIAEMVVQFDSLREGDPPASLKVIGWNTLAQDMQAKYHQGDRLIIEGRLSMNVADSPHGYKEKWAELTAQRIHQLGAGERIVSSSENVSDASGGRGPAAMPPVSAPVTTPSPAPAMPVSPTETDYDEIPF